MNVPPTDSFGLLSAEQKSFARKIADNVTEALNDYAGLMDAGEIPMRAGPDALREFAATINIVLIERE